MDTECKNWMAVRRLGLNFISADLSLLRKMLSWHTEKCRPGHGCTVGILSSIFIYSYDEIKGRAFH